MTFFEFVRKSVRENEKLALAKFAKACCTLIGVTRFEAISPKPHKCSKERRFGHLAKIIINQSLNQFPIDEKYEYWKLRTDLR